MVLIATVSGHSLPFTFGMSCSQAHEVWPRKLVTNMKGL